MLYAGIALVFATVAIPIRLDGYWITLAWAAEGLVLVWCGLRVIDAGAAVPGLLMFLDRGGAVDVPDDQCGPSPAFLLNARFLVMAFCAAAAALAFYFARHSAVGIQPPESHLYFALAVAANVCFLVAISWKCGIFFDRLHRSDSTGGWRKSWGFRCCGSLTRWRRSCRDSRWKSVALRWQGLILMGVAIAKVFLFDLSFLSSFYRIVSFFALGLVLLGVSFFYQKMARRRTENVRAAGESGGPLGRRRPHGGCFWRSPQRLPPLRFPARGRHWRFWRTIELLSTDSLRLAGLVLPQDVYLHAQPSLPDFASSTTPATKFPTLTTLRRGSASLRDLPTEVLENSFAPGADTQVVLNVGAVGAVSQRGRNQYAANRILSNGFRWRPATTRMSGASWKTRAPIFRFRQQSREGTQTVHYSPNNARYLRVRVLDGDRKFPVASAQVIYNAVETPERSFLEAEIVDDPENAPEKMPGASIWELRRWECRKCGSR